MTTYGTGNAVGSNDPRDLYDNAENLDQAVNGPAAMWTDRRGQQRPSWAGMVSYQVLGAYAGAMSITGYNQLVLQSGEYYKLKASVALPFTTSGTWGSDAANFVSVGDAVLRGDLANVAFGDSLTGVQKTGGQPTSQHVVNEYRSFNLRTDWPSTIGDGVADDGPELVLGIAAGNELELSAGTYLTASVAVTQPLNHTLIFQPGAKITASGSGSFTPAGNQIKYGWNPSARTTWANGSSQNYEGLSADIGNFGVRDFLGIGLVAAVSGAVSIPNAAAIPAHAMGVAGYAKTDSTTTGAVGVFGYALPLRDGAAAFAGNFVVTDNGHFTAVWGVEIDCNITNVNSAVRGLSITGGSTVEPAFSPAIDIGPMGVGTSPVKRWSHGLLIDDGGAQIGVQIGALFPTASASALFQMMYRDGANTQQRGMFMSVDASGNTSICGDVDNTVLNLSSKHSSVQQNQIRLSADKMGFFTSLGTSKPTWTGSRGGNTALASLFTSLSGLGLGTDSTTA